MEVCTSLDRQSLTEEELISNLLLVSQGIPGSIFRMDMDNLSFNSKPISVYGAHPFLISKLSDSFLIAAIEYCKLNELCNYFHYFQEGSTSKVISLLVLC